MIVWCLCVCVCVCCVRVSYVCALTAGAMANDATPNTVTLISTRLCLFLMLNQKHATELWASAMSLTSTGSHPPDINITPPSSSTLNSVRRGFFLNLHMFLYIYQLVCFIVHLCSALHLQILYLSLLSIILSPFFHRVLKILT